MITATELSTAMELSTATVSITATASITVMGSSIVTDLITATELSTATALTIAMAVSYQFLRSSVVFLLFHHLVIEMSSRFIGLLWLESSWVLDIVVMGFGSYISNKN